MAHQRTPDVTGADVERIVLRDFPSGSLRALEILNQYGAEEWHREPDRVRLAALKLAAGSIDALRSAVETAKRDYRDVVALAEYPEYSRSMSPSRAVARAERERIIAADWRQYSEWLAR